MEQELLDEIDAQLSYGDSRSAWVRDAIQLKLAIADELEEIDSEVSEEKRREFIIEAIQEKAEK